MYPNGYDPNAVIAQALAMQPATMPYLPPIQSASQGYYGPTHRALSDALAAALANQMTNAGLLAPVSAQGMGLLANNSAVAPASNFYHLSPAGFNSSASNLTPATPSAAGAPANSAQMSNGGSHYRGAADQPVYSPDFTSSNGPVGNANGYTGPYDNGGGPGATFNDGSFLGGITSSIAKLFTPQIQTTPTSIDAPGSDTMNNAPAAAPAASAPAPAPVSNDLTGYRVSYSPITGTPLAAPSNAGVQGYVSGAGYSPYESSQILAQRGAADQNPLANSYGLLSTPSNPGTAIYTVDPNLNFTTSNSGLPLQAQSSVLGYGPNPYALPGYDANYGNYSFANPDNSMGGLLSASVGDSTQTQTGNDNGDHSDN